MLLIQFSTNVAGKAAEDGPRSWVPATHIGQLDGIPGSWLLPGPAPAPAVVGIYGMNQWIKITLIFSLSLSLCLRNK